MDIKAKQILQSALCLEPSERAEIAASLISSLDANIDAAWGEEVKRRIESIDQGDVQLISAVEVLREMREQFS